jgi:hypothetical protein
MRRCILVRHLKPTRESLHINDLLSLVASRVYVIEKLLAHLREGGTDGRREGVCV